MYVFRMKNGNLKVPVVGTDENGVGHTLVEVRKGTPEWRRWKDEVKQGLVREHMDWHAEIPGT